MTSLAGKGPGLALKIPIGDVAINMNRSSIKLLIFSAIFLSLIACNPVQKVKDRKHTEDLEAATDTYRKLIRWGYYDQAVQYIKARDDSAVNPDLVEASRFKVTHYTITNRYLSDDLQDAQVVATIEYYEVESGVAKVIRDEQHWWYEPEGKRWHLSSGLPDFVGGFR